MWDKAVIHPHQKVLMLKGRVQLYKRNPYLCASLTLKTSTRQVPYSIGLSHKNLPGSQASFYNSVVQTEHSVIIKSLPLVTQLRQISLNTKQILKLQTKRRTQFSRLQRFVSKGSNHNQQDQTATEINATCIKTF